MRFSLWNIQPYNLLQYPIPMPYSLLYRMHHVLSPTLSRPDAFLHTGNPFLIFSFSMRSRLASAYSAKMSKNGTRTPFIGGSAGEAVFGFFNGLRLFGALVVISVSLVIIYMACFMASRRH